MGASMELAQERDDRARGRERRARGGGAERALFSNAGQLCISIERLFVHDSIADEFTSKLVERVRAMTLGTAPRLPAPSMGSLSSQAQLDTVRKPWTTRVEGAEVLAAACTSDVARVLLRADAARGGGRRDVAVPRRDVRPGGGILALLRRGGRDRARQHKRLRLNFRCDERHAAGLEIGSRSSRGTVNVNEGYIAAWRLRRADGRDEGLGPRPPAWRGGHQEVHRGADRAVQKLMPIATPPGIPYRLWTRVMSRSLRLLRRTPGIR